MMEHGLLAQYVVVAFAVLASACAVMRKQFPGATRKLRIAIALSLLGQGAGPWRQALGRRIAPIPRAGESKCSGCDSCD